jgi:hypothetical protein
MPLSGRIMHLLISSESTTVVRARGANSKSQAILLLMFGGRKNLGSLGRFYFDFFHMFYDI